MSTILDDRAIVLDGLEKAYAGVPVIGGMCAEIREGEFVAILGASGCGKSTLLNIIAGLDRPTGGAVEVDERGAALMFQDAALYPWLTARENIELALSIRGVPRAQLSGEAQRLLDIVRLGEAGEKRPHELSGGMRQRVSLARSLAQDRPILLMDEPFAALDAITRDVLHAELRRVWRETGRTIVFVTHNVSEAVSLGQRILLLSSRPGRVIDEWHVPDAETASPEQITRLTTEITGQLRKEISRHVSERAAA
jgi:NitT/TauT family transport system ATP-binding protein